MNRAGHLKHFIFAFVIAAVLYAVCYTAIERRRTRNGPWRVTFTSSSDGSALMINEPKLGISNFTISFPVEKAAATNLTMVFDQPQPVPFDVPFGQCVFMDTTFRPGTIVFKSFGHEIQLLPRVLTIDKKEIPWEPGGSIALPGNRRENRSENGTAR
jgi:hypothetical protein